MGLHVVHSCTSLSYSGLERYVIDLVSHQNAQGHSVELFCRDGSELAREAKKRNVPVWLIGKTAPPSPLLWGQVYLGWRKRLAKHKRVALHMHHAGELWFHKARPKLEKAVLQFHLWINHAKRDPFHSWLYGGVDELWCSSESASKHLQKLLPLPESKFRVIPYGRQYETLAAMPRDQWRSEIRASLGIPKDAVVGLTIARIEPIKGIAELFEGFLTVAPSLPQAHLIVVGGPSPENQEAAEFAAALEERYSKLTGSIRERIHFTGFATKVERFMAAADFYVLPSYEECMSLALLDALILGLPAIGTDAGGTPSVVRENETGIVVPARQTAPLAEALARLYSQSDLRRKLGAGAAALGQNFDETKIFSRIWASYAAATATENSRTDLTQPLA